MKQLLERCGPHLVVALGDRAVVLLHSHSNEKDSNDKWNVTSLELLTSPPSSEDNNNNNDNNTSKKKKKANNNKNDEKKNGNNPIQAVAAMEHGESLLCAVSRLDKSLSIYSIPTTTTTTTTTTVKATLDYITVKRVCSLTLTTIGNNIPLVITADLAGDAVAYPATMTMDGNDPKKRLLLGHTASMLTSVKLTSDSELDRNGNDDDQKKEQIHTTTNGRRILTSDRDEKVRISCFPQTSVVQGYLMGHTAFVSSLDTAGRDGCTRCVTASGDGTVRLWDYVTCQQLSLVEAQPLPSLGAEPVESAKEDTDSTPAATPSNKEEEDEDKKDNESNNKHDKRDGKNKIATHVVIPTAVQTNADGTVVVIARDGSNTVQIVQFQNIDDDVRMEHRTIQEITCPAQPLGLSLCHDENSDELSLYILTCDPKALLLHYCSSTTANTLHNNPSSAACQTLQNLVSKEWPSSSSSLLQMPTTVLEEDESTGQLKMLKGKDTLGFVPRNSTANNNHTPWNRNERKAKDRLKNAKRKKRRREEKRLEGGEGNSHMNDDDDDDAYS